MAAERKDNRFELQKLRSDVTLYDLAKLALCKCRELPSDKSLLNITCKIKYIL